MVGIVPVVALGVVLGSSSSALGEKAATFEDALADAEPAGDLAQLFGPLFADCKREDELSTRQCSSVRDWLAEKLHGGTYWAVGDESALSWAPYDPSEKKQELDVQGCLACGQPLPIEGKLRFVTTRVPKAIKAGHAVGLDVGFPSVAQPNEKTAAEWQKKMAPRLRVEFVFRVGPVWKSGAGDKAFEGVTFVPLAYRVFDRCSGRVVASDPPSSSVTVNDAPALRDASCPEEISEAEQRKREDALLPAQLSPKQINLVMAPIKERVHDCYAEFEVSGTATVKLVVDRDGSIETMNVLAPFDKTPTGYCISTALKGTSFPHFRGDKMIITYPFKVN